MGDRIAAAAYVSDDATDAALRGGLSEFLGSLQIRRGGIRAAAKVMEQTISPRVLIVDVSGVDDQLGELDALAAVCAPDTKVLVIGERQDLAFYREITRHLGVDEYLAKPLTRDNASTLIGPYMAGVEPERASVRGGRVIAVCGVRGGVGATTVAINLALQIADSTHGHVALLDLHLRGGQMATMLGITPVAGLRNALERPGDADALLFERLAIPVSDRVRLLAADEGFETDPAPTAAGIAHLLALLCQRFNAIVIDMPMPPSPTERQALLLARHALLVLGPDVGSLHNVELMRRMLASLIGGGRTMTVLNRYGAAGALKRDLIKEGLGTEPDIIIPDLPKPLNRAANLGRAALRDSPVLQRALAPLTQEIAGVALRRKGGLLRRVFGR
ncbi:AAA family ATPase [Falsiroseomonas sp. E2-1-a4]|uniref:AAA family ATPase n=1 Tax=Falsiroseomonas sp. E2-1-a4 TaxID=3239299 RepID=UPI003F3A7F43